MSWRRSDASKGEGMRSEQCWSTNCRRVVRAKGGIHCGPCEASKRKMITVIRRTRNRRKRAGAVFWTICFGMFNTREVERLFR